MNRIDRTRPDSPPLAGPGPWPVGVETRVLTDPARFAPEVGAVVPRALTVECWYPAASGTPVGGIYRSLLRDGVTPVCLHGRAARGAAPAEGEFPLVLISHGYPGNRYLMAHLAESLASRGYRVAAADHPGSTYDDQAPIGATLYHRPLDQRFLLETLGGVAVIGYSMGGYGALVTAGAGVSPDLVGHEIAPPGGVLAIHRHPEPPEGLRAVVAIGPWGNGRGVWPEGALAGVGLPLMVMAGSLDDTSDYEAMRGIARAAGGTLVTFENAGHNAAAPIPAPEESHAHSDVLGWAPFLHYADAVWDSVRMNALAQHFATAFLDRHVKGDAGCDAWLDPMRGAADMPGVRLERWEKAGPPAR